MDPNCRQNHVYGRTDRPAAGLLEPYEKSLIRGSYRLARKTKPRELAKEQALRMFVGWVRKNSGKEVSEARVREAEAYLNGLVRAEGED